jgi:RNA polymerase sigma-70 factor (ECF subfamily)
MSHDDRAITVAEIDAALARVRARDRDIFLAHRLDGLSYDVIAIRHRIGVRRVERVIARVLTQLRREVERQRRRG